MKFPFGHNPKNDALPISGITPTPAMESPLTAPITPGVPAQPPAPAAPKRMRVGDVLVQEGHVTREQLEKALAEQKGTGKMVGEALVAQGVISPTALVRALAKVMGVAGVVLRHGLLDPAVMKLVGAEECERLKLIPMFKVGNTLTVA
ncbi:MAG TPA: hypothetical protein VK157_06810, partial [Phycisphaerales bacterium]|nr:hypothetical protein [Phycisphaerales bacterium]